MTDIKVLLSKLNEEQIKPVLDTEGAVLVIAGAGSGKTRVLTTRIAYLVLEKDVNPGNIMAITFTNKAAGEMKERLVKFVGGIGDMWVSTIHSMCVKILRSHIDKLGYDRNFTIYDETDKDKALKLVLERLNLPADKFLKSAKSIISNAKNDCLSPDAYKQKYYDFRLVQEFYSIYSEYEKDLARSNSLDFDDLLFKTYQLFVEHQDVASYYSNKFEYIHIDEFQDTNTVQFEIVKRLALSHGNLFVVGDDDQSIYGWRGAKIENILNFDDIYRGAKVYKLERNYRSTKKILQLANAIISHNTERREKELWTDNSDGVKVETFVGMDENNEAAFTALQIKNLMARSSLTYRDFAVFMRINGLSRAYEQEFMKYGIPYKVYGGVRFFERKEIKDVLAYLKLMVNPSDNQSFIRAIGVPKRGIGEKTLTELREFSSSLNLSMSDGVMMVDNTTIGNAARVKLTNFNLLIDSFRTYSKENTITDTIKYVLDTTNFLDQFSEKNEENTARLYNVSELRNSALQFETDNKGATLADFLNSITLSSDTDDLNSEDNVTIATIHAAKGLEYKCVFVAGLDEKIIPIIRSTGDDGELEEERRLLYVAVTRAMERLYLTRATSRYLYGNREYMTQSRFLKEVQHVISPSIAKDENLVRENRYESRSYNNYADDDKSDFRQGAGYSSSYAKTFLKGNKPTENRNIEYFKYVPGTKVKHTKFGEGVIINVKGEGENKVVEVLFKGIGMKTLSAKFAPMEII